LERAKTQGIETELEFDLASLLSLSLSHVYMKAKNKTTGQRLTERPKHIVNTQLRWRLENSGLTAMVRASYHGNEVDNDAFGNVVNLPGYMLWYAQGAWDLDDRLQVTFGVKNIGDLKLANKSQNFSFAERGRTFYIGVRHDL
jgi:outer membrane receptor for ferrienterochelin and colicins